MRVCVSTFAAAIALLFLGTYLARAQEFPMSDRQKASIERKKADEKANDDAYEATIKRLHGAKPKTVDPWASVRPPSTGSGN